MVKSFKVLFMIPFAFSVSTFSMQASQEALRKKLQGASASDIFRTLEGAKVAAFSMDYLIKNGFEAKALTNWENLTALANEMVNEVIFDHPDYAIYLATIEQAYRFIKNSVASLHTKYGAHFVRVPKKDEITVDLTKTSFASGFASGDIKELNEVIRLAQGFAQSLHEINQSMMQNINDNTPIAQSWSKDLYSGKTIKDAQTIFKKYKAFLQAYRSENSSDPKAFFKKQKINNKYDAMNLLDKLEKVAFIMDVKLKVPDQARSADLKTVQEIINKIHEVYPDALSPLQGRKFADTTDKASIIIFAQTAALEAVAKQLAREAKQIRAKAQGE